jgi:hypothetical protein
MMNLVGAVSNTLLIFVFPILCDYVLEKREGIRVKPTFEFLFEVLIVLVGLIGGAFGTYDALLALYTDIFPLH